YMNEYSRPNTDFNVWNTGTNSYMKPNRISQFRGEGILGYLDYGRQARYKRPTQPVVLLASKTQRDSADNIGDKIFPKLQESTLVISTSDFNMFGEKFKETKVPYVPNLNTDLSAYLKSVGQSATYTDRKKMYEQATGKKDYIGSAEQNISLLGM